MPKAWQDKADAEAATDVPALWKSLAPHERVQGLRDLWDGGRSAPGPEMTALARWDAWFRAGLPVDHAFSFETGSTVSTPLGFALSNHDTPLALIALDHGADPNALERTFDARAGKGGTPLLVQRPVGVHLAYLAQAERMPLVRAMLGKGWDPTVSLDARKSFVAVMVEELNLTVLAEVARLRPDTDWNAPNKNGRTPLGYLLDNRNSPAAQRKAMAHWLAEQGATVAHMAVHDQVPFWHEALLWGDADLLVRLTQDSPLPVAVLRARLSNGVVGASPEAARVALAFLDAHELRAALPESRPTAPRPRL